MNDIFIIGGGPAGVVASLYTARAGLKTAIICKDYGALGTAEVVDNFYGHLDINGRTLVDIGLEQARRVGVDVLMEEVVGLSLGENDENMITIETTSATYNAQTIVLATGANRSKPHIKGLKELEGRGVSYCAICDGYFHRGKDVAVLGSGSYALHEVEDLLPIAANVTLLTNGNEPEIEFPMSSITVRKEKISELIIGRAMLGEVLQGVRLENGEEISISGLFIAEGTAGGTELARKIGAEIDSNGYVKVDDNMRTSVAGIWAAGDCTGGLKQISKAVYDGTRAGIDIVQLSKKRSRQIHKVLNETSS